MNAGEENPLSNQSGQGFVPEQESIQDNASKKPFFGKGSGDDRTNEPNRDKQQPPGRWPVLRAAEGIPSSTDSAQPPSHDPVQPCSPDQHHKKRRINSRAHLRPWDDPGVSNVVTTM